VATSERTNPPFLPLGAAAARLGISSDALRMRVKRGKARSFKQAGRVYVYLPEQTEWPVRATSEQNEQIESARSDSGAGPGATPATEATGEAIPVVIAFQKVELTRLLKENERLNRRYDQLMEELKHLREMQQREQVLRQQELGLRQQLQTALDRLGTRLSPPRPAVTGSLAQAKAKAKVRAAQSPAATRPDGAPPAPQPPRAGAQTRPESAPANPRPTTQRPEDAALRPPTDPEPSPPDAESPDVLPPITDDEAADLAEILREVGQSLRDLEEDEPFIPAPSPLPAGPRETLEGDQGSLGTPAAQSRLRDEERQKAGRVMKRLFRGRNDQEPEET
jgi:hypothetical protein